MPVGGPLSTSGISSRVNRSTALLILAARANANLDLGRVADRAARRPMTCVVAEVLRVDFIELQPELLSLARTIRSAACAFSSACGQLYTSVPMAL